MRNSLLRPVVGCLIVLGLSSSPAVAQTDLFSGGVPPVPPILEVQAGYSLFFKGHAIGTQNYVCLPAATPSGVAWTFMAPQATLFHTFRGDIDLQLTTHYLSANPDEGGVARATWQHSFDSSRVWARMVQSSRDSNYVKPGAIPWLLLEAMGSERGPLGGILTPAKFIQRLNTSGGSAPATGCTSAANIGALTLVPYEADYFFYRKNSVR